MKKIILLASALAFGGVAYAQDTTPAPTTQPDMSAPDSAAQPPADAAAPASPDASAPAPDAGMAPDAAAPAQPGMDPSQAPADPSQAGAPAPGTATGPNGPVSMTPTQGATDLPACSKTVTDNCKQGAGRSGGKAAHHRRKHK